VFVPKVCEGSEEVPIKNGFCPKHKWAMREEISSEEFPVNVLSGGMVLMGLS
jgi:hypothetical protein